MKHEAYTMDRCRARPSARRRVVGYTLNPGRANNRYQETLLIKGAFGIDFSLSYTVLLQRPFPMLSRLRGIDPCRARQSTRRAVVGYTHDPKP